MENTVQRVQNAYATYLGRSAEPAGVSFWVQQIGRGLTDEALAASVVASDEFFAVHA